MHKNYYLFKRQIQQLTPGLIKNHIVKKVFTIKKNELIIQLKHQNSDHQSYLFISIQNDLPYIILSESVNEKKPRFYLFEEVNQSVLQNITIEDRNKFIHLYFDNYIIEAWFFGNSCNVLLKDKSRKLLNSFKRFSSTDEETKPVVHDFNFDEQQQAGRNRCQRACTVNSGTIPTGEY